MSKKNLFYEVILGIFYEVFENPQGGLSPKLEVGLGQALSFNSKNINILCAALINFLEHTYV